jgi:hypothetical protein
MAFQQLLQNCGTLLGRSPMRRRHSDSHSREAGQISGKLANIKPAWPQVCVWIQFSSDHAGTPFLHQCESLDRRLAVRELFQDERRPFKPDAVAIDDHASCRQVTCFQRVSPRCASTGQASTIRRVLELRTCSFRHASHGRSSTLSTNAAARELDDADGQDHAWRLLQDLGMPELRPIPK